MKIHWWSTIRQASSLTIAYTSSPFPEPPLYSRIRFLHVVSLQKMVRLEALKWIEFAQNSLAPFAKKMSFINYPKSSSAPREKFRKDLQRNKNTLPITVWIENVQIKGLKKLPKSCFVWECVRKVGFRKEITEFSWYKDQKLIQNF